MILWSLRLALFLAYRVHKTGKDDRFDDKRDSFFPFLGFWIFQMIWVFTISLPVTILNSPAVTEAPGGRTVELGTARDVIGLIMWGVGWLLESVADWQRFAWREKNKTAVAAAPAAGKGQWCETGVWKWSRHPNYFGEMLLQFGIYTIAVTPAFHDEANLSGGAKAALHASIVGPILLTLLLLFVSGMNLSERSGARKRWEIGGDVWEGYKAYLDRTSILIPVPRVIWKGLPGWVKGTVGFQWRLYQFAPEVHGAVRDDDNAGAAAGDGDEHRDGHGKGGRGSAEEGLV